MKLPIQSYSLFILKTGFDDFAAQESHSQSNCIPKRRKTVFRIIPDHSVKTVQNTQNDVETNRTTTDKQPNYIF